MIFGRFYFYIFCSFICLNRIYESSAATKVNEQHEKGKDSLRGYEVTIQTGNEYAIAGTKSNVSFQLVGRKRESEWFVLRDEFATGKLSKFTLRTRSVGMLLMVRIENIKVKYGEKEKIFPLYEFITDVAEVINGRSKLPQNLVNPILLIQRKREIERNMVKWMWKENQEKGPDFGLPRIMEADKYTDLPNDVKMEDDRYADFYRNAEYIDRNLDVNLKQYYMTPWSSLEAYKNIFSSSKVNDDKLPDFIHEWDTDQEFGRQVLNGINPTAVEVCTGVIEGSNITYDYLDGLIEENTIEKAIKKGKLFMVNHFESLKGVPRNLDNFAKQLYAADPLCLLYSYSNGTFAPVAIQLKANDSSTIFTPNDNQYDWLLAKMHFRCTDGNHHEWISHYLKTHAAIEPIAIATMRLLPRSHPIYKLLRPHLRTIIAINQLARELLLPSYTRAQRILSISGYESARKGYKDFSFKELNIPKLLQKRGTQKLKNYLYRDDALELWKIVGKYVRLVIQKFYTSDQDVKDDYELQNWIYETATKGFGWEDGNTRGVPTKFDTVEELSSFCTSVIATGSIQHTAVSFGQWYVYQYVPNSPLGLRQPIHKHGDGSLQKIMETLQSIVGSTIQAGLTYMLSQHSPGEVYLGQFPMDLFEESRIQVIRNIFHEELQRYQEVISNRNNHIKYPYEHLRANRLPVGTSL